MIRLRASAVLAVRDGYSGQPITASTVQCFLDGQRMRPQYRQGGYLVFLNMESGRHELLLRGAYYQDERLELEIGDIQPAEYSVTLKPSPAYPFRRAVTQLTACLEQGSASAGQPVWVAVQNAAEQLRLAQDEATTGDRALKLYYRGGPEGRFPGHYLICDQGKSEAVLLEQAQDEQVTLRTPLVHKHKRGTVLLPAQAYHTDAQGRIQVFFREPAPVYLFHPASKKLYSMELKQGYNETALTKALEKKE